MPEDKNKQTPAKVWAQYMAGIRFNTQQNLDAIVQTNENFFIGKQWEGVDSGGLPTPVFNFLKRVTLFTIASITSDNVKMVATPMQWTPEKDDPEDPIKISDVVNSEFESLFEQNSISMQIRKFMRNAAVDGDGCTFTYWDENAENGTDQKGAIVTEVIENTRVFFGNPNDARVQKQPYIIITSRDMVDDVRERAKENGSEDWESIAAGSATVPTNAAMNTNDKVTVVLKLWRNKETGTIWGYECTDTVEVRKAWDLGLKLYPVTWINWDYVQDSYHGMSMITGLIPNQIFINKMFAMTMISLMTTAFPKVVYDNTRIKKWDNRVGAAIGANGGDINSVAKIIDPAQVSPQIAQFIDLAINTTQDFLGATAAAMGDTRPDNTSAIIALQRAASVPQELVKQNLYQTVEDLGRIYIDFMSVYYGTRTILVNPPADMSAMLMFANINPNEKVPYEYDFAKLRNVGFRMNIDVGASSYWSEIASMQTLDNLLTQGKISLEDYLERIPNGYISKREELLAKIKGLAMQQQMAQGGMMPQGEEGVDQVTGEEDASSVPIPLGAGNGQLQRAIVRGADVV